MIYTTIQIDNEVIQCKNCEMMFTVNYIKKDDRGEYYIFCNQGIGNYTNTYCFYCGKKLIKGGKR